MTASIMATGTSAFKMGMAVAPPTGKIGCVVCGVCLCVVCVCVVRVSCLACVAGIVCEHDSDGIFLYA